MIRALETVYVLVRDTVQCSYVLQGCDRKQRFTSLQEGRFTESHNVKNTYNNLQTSSHEREMPQPPDGCQTMAILHRF